MMTEEGNSGRPRLAGGTIRDAQDSPAGGGLPHARLGERSGRRCAGFLVATQRFGPKRHRELGRMADDSCRAGVPRHASRAHVAARGAAWLDPDASHADGVDPEQEALLADAVGIALLVVLDTLAPAERLAFVLHDMFAVPFDEIAPIVGRSSNAAKQLASRARRRVQQATTSPATDLTRQRDVVGAFLAASREGNFDGLLAMLDPDVVLRADDAAVRMGASAEVRGAGGVAGTFSGRARAAQRALVDGAAGAVWAPGGKLEGWAT